jgi:Tfp pilus assembly protein PilX
MITNKKQMIQKLRNNQAGMASILITMITMIVVSLVVIGFATISEREQGQTLDQQLSTQAFYAAESGVEDARNVIASAVKNGLPVPSKTGCTTNNDGSYTPNYPTGATTVLDATHNVSYSCLLVNPGPTTLVYDGVSDSSVVIPMTASLPINTITVTWSPTTPQTGTPSAQCPASTSGTFSTAAKWTCGYGLFRMDLVPTAGALTHAGLGNGDLTAYFEPTSNSASGSVSYPASVGAPSIVAGNCNVSSYTQCTATITGLTSTSYTMRIMSLYQSSNITVVGYNGGTKLALSGAQAVIDVTGNANGVLRRIEVNIPLNNYNGTIPDYAIESNGAVCKRFLVTPGYFSIPNDIVNPDTSNSMCVAQTSGTPASGG